MENITLKTPRGRPAGSRQKTNPSDAVVRVRKALGLTQEEFAREMSCSVATIRRYEQNQLLPGLPMAQSAFDKLAKKAAVTIDAP